MTAPEGIMRRTIRLLADHATFFLPYLLFLVLGGALLLSTEAGDTILFFNGNRTRGLDYFFQYGTALGEGLFFALATVVLLWLGFRYALMVPVLGLMVSILAQTAKRLFAHPRPFAYFRQLGMDGAIDPIEGVDVYTGMNSFPSGHTMAAFALFAYLALCTPHKRWSGLLFFTLALIVALSRMYLVHHFLKDVYLGSLLGVFLALVCFLLAEYLPARRFPWLDRRAPTISPFGSRRS